MNARRGWSRPWLLWFAVLGVVTAAMSPYRDRLDKAHIVLAYLLVVLGASADAGRAVGVVVAASAFVAFNYLFLPPYQTLHVTDPLDFVVLLTFLVTSIVAAQLLYRANAKTAEAVRRATELDRLASASAGMVRAPSAGEALGAVTSMMIATLDADRCLVLRAGRDGIPGELARSERVARRESADEAAELATLTRRVLETGRSAAVMRDGTDRTDPFNLVGAVDTASVTCLLLPLTARTETVGVIRVDRAQGIDLTAETERLSMALAHLGSLGVERMLLVESAERAETERRVEALRSALLTSVSHDLRTPLTTIKGIAHEIGDGADPSRAQVIEQEVDRLNTMIGDLLQLSRIQANAVEPQLAMNTVDDLVGTALQRAAGVLHGRAVAVDLSESEMLVGHFDLAQTVRVLVNLLENAAKYAPAETPLEVTVRDEGEAIAIAVGDLGPGVPESERERIFEPFYRPAGVPSDVSGSGLGLSIARGLAVAQGGSVRYQPRRGGGAQFVLRVRRAQGAPP